MGQRVRGGGGGIFYQLEEGGDIHERIDSRKIVQALFLIAKIMIPFVATTFSAILRMGIMNSSLYVNELFSLDFYLFRPVLASVPRTVRCW